MEFNQLIKQVLGDMLLAIGFMSYMGPFPGEYRAEIADGWLETIKDQQLLCGDGFSFVKMMGSPLKIQDWMIKGLPNDSVSKENVIMMQLSQQ